VKKTLLSSAITAVMFALCLACACFTSGQASAQQPMMSAAQQAPSGIALVDIHAILLKHVRLRAALEALHAEAEQVRKDFEQQAQQLQEDAKQLTVLKTGTPQYQELEEKLVSRKALLQSGFARKKQEFEQREAKGYYNAYREVTDEVNCYCRQYGIILVLQVNRDGVHEDNPADISRGMSKSVVYYNPSLDITDRILPRFVQPLSANRDAGPMGVGPGYYPQK
jgi:Skp family chaperone for outer membrane proteins